MLCPLVSIIVPVFNVEPYLRRCLDSIVNQTYTNLEIILVDDGSPDNCPAICDEYAARDKRVVVIHKDNGGLSDARNAGLDICNGEYISFVDSDDWVDKRYVEILLEPLQIQKYDFIIADYAKTAEMSSDKHLFCPKGLIHGNDAIVSAYCRQTYPPSAWGKLYKRSFIETKKFRFKKKLLFEDQLWSCQLAVAAQNIFTIHEKLYNYTVRTDSIMQSSDTDFTKKIISWKIIISSEKKILEPYRKKLSSDFDLFFRNKIAEMLKMTNFERKHYNEAFLSLMNGICENPIVYWCNLATPIRKIFWKLILSLPLTFSRTFFYYYLK